MTRLVEILVGLNAALGIVTWLSVRVARRRREQPPRRTVELAPRQLPPPADRDSDERRDP